MQNTTPVSQKTESETLNNDTVLVELDLPESLCRRIEAAGKDPAGAAREAAMQIVAKLRAENQVTVRSRQGSTPVTMTNLTRLAGGRPHARLTGRVEGGCKPFSFA